MESFYLFAIGLLFLLAIFDLVVGVSNDAVNFLNSAIGSKVASFKKIMIIASLGILLGAVSSGGMMEIARNGIYNPQHFYFNEVMIIFLAVMITDIILLDIFNTLGMPTSTTVSIVFELLGAAFAVSIIKTIQGNSPMNFIFNADNPEAGIIGYMNWGKAGQIISGILLSVIIAFTVGAIVQYFSRLIFGFQYKKRMKYFGSIWAGIASTVILYFLIYKGLGGMTKGVDEAKMNSFQKAFTQIHHNIDTHLLIYIVACFVISTIIMFILNARKINILKIVVLMGTFSLAMAFAGNDLVNFIGVPIAGWQSWLAWEGSGVAPNSFLMDSIAGRVETPYFLLVIAGIIMVLTLWFSKKSRNVTETEVNLGAQSEVDERFEPNIVARGIVNGARAIGNGFNAVLPNSIKPTIEKRFTPISDLKEEPTGAAFDLVRASVNLVVASLLIVSATSLKLPLSTTYVSFMVAMGTSLSDRAWGRESAVYRIAGVMNVIAGWFLTAIIALTAAAIAACIMYFGGIYGIIFMVCILGFVIYRTSRTQKLSLTKKIEKEKRASVDYKDLKNTLHILSSDVSSSLKNIKSTLHNTFDGLHKEDKKTLKKAKKSLDSITDDYAMVKEGLFKVIKKNKSDETTYSHLYVLTYDLMQDAIQSLELIVNVVDNHVKNNHKPLNKEQNEKLKTIENELISFLDYLEENIKTENFSILDEVIARKIQLQNLVEKLTSDQIAGVMNKDYGFKNSSLYFTILLEIKDLVAVSARFIKLFDRTTKKGELP